MAYWVPNRGGRVVRGPVDPAAIWESRRTRRPRRVVRGQSERKDVSARVATSAPGDDVLVTICTSAVPAWLLLPGMAPAVVARASQKSLSVRVRTAKNRDPSSRVQTGSLSGRRFTQTLGRVTPPVGNIRGFGRKENGSTRSSARTPRFKFRGNASTRAQIASFVIFLEFYIFCACRHNIMTLDTSVGGIFTARFIE